MSACARRSAAPDPPGRAQAFHGKRSRRSALSRWLIALALLPLRLYRRFVSPALPRRCKYEPTCSAYAEEAIRELGLVRGTILAGWRLLRCNPLSDGGLDPVSERRLFRDAGAAEPASEARAPEWEPREARP